MSENKTGLEDLAREKSYNHRALVLAFIFLFVNFAVYFFKFRTEISGNAISDILNFSGELSAGLVIFILQWFALVIFVIVLYIRHLRRKVKVNNNINLNNFSAIKNSKSGTDMDVLYLILEEKGELNISMISELFKVNKEKALGWCKILEEHNLAHLAYPAFSEPILKRK